MMEDKLASKPSEELLLTLLKQSQLSDGDFGTVSLQEMQSTGMENRVYQLDSKHVLRINNADYAREMYEKEARCLETVSQLGILSPRVIETGNFDGWSYSIHSFCVGTQGFEAAQPDDVWETLGQYARTIHEIATDGFGSSINSSRTLSFSKTWEEWVDEEIEEIASDSLLERERILTDAEKSRAINLLKELSNWEFDGRLCHGDLSLANTIIGDSKEIYLLDWGNAISHRAPHYDLAEIQIWNPDGAALKAFSKGYELDSRELQKIEDEVKLLKLWRGLWAARRDIKHFTNWRATQYIERSLSAIRQGLKS